ncbi:FAD-binding oxidoreductase [Agrobacterium sp. Ap1]|jgi:D-amino-acid dehydrogenase|uniref:D-amino-acid dehydrogenase n=2 Tax=Hyphomicrobiales TaxID=356 RepID=A0A7W6WQ32_9HYPH|nr:MULTISPECIES: FAD-binding oxidoreductase [Rhizobium/Agrobacterium group]MBB4348736.1 D-amino-acid dehydrogenase [Rhizobium cellulosilyticum]MBB4411972.1 D-amino-acid dehydrogenase [Rhizobium cellulosilyticum]MBB4449428.1 D-amino-acid dehydrogenase [Rhizobium cellulosilyticum]MBO0141239.1 FAD-binding oxidoreductase [Agrobacterium sp. Ap1]
MARSDIVVIGAGVVGLSVAIAAQMRGFNVTVIDREGPAAGASAGNAGAFAFTDILPLASPGILKKAPKWLLDPLGPLSIPPAYALNIAPWMFRFWRACSASRVAHSTSAQTALMDLSKAELEPFLSATDTLSMLRKEGNLQVYESDAEFRTSLPGWEAREEHGIEFQHMDAAEMAGIQPGIAPRFIRGTFTPGWYSIADPKLYTLVLAENFRARGGVVEIAEVKALRPVSDGVEIVLAGDVARLAGKVVLAAGAFSHRIARTLGENIPLETERGYNTTLPSDALDLRTQVTFGGHGFVVTRLTSGIRVGGAVELGGLSLPPNYARSEAMLKKAKSFLPGLKTEGGVQWMGFRPSMPDSLPAIGRAKATANVVYAFGHGHLGLTQSAGTARLVADLLQDQSPAMDLTAFSPSRFG